MAFFLFSCRKVPINKVGIMGSPTLKSASLQDLSSSIFLPFLSDAPRGEMFREAHFAHPRWVKWLPRFPLFPHHGGPLMPLLPSKRLISPFIKGHRHCCLFLSVKAPHPLRLVARDLLFYARYPLFFWTSPPLLSNRAVLVNEIT